MVVTFDYGKVAIRGVFLDRPIFCMGYCLNFLVLGGIQENTVLIGNSNLFLVEYAERTNPLLCL